MCHQIFQNKRGSQHSTSHQNTIEQKEIKQSKIKYNLMTQNKAKQVKSIYIYIYVNSFDFNHDNFLLVTLP